MDVVPRVALTATPRMVGKDYDAVTRYHLIWKAIRLIYIGYSIASIDDPDWVIWAAWADRITFEEIEKKTGKLETKVG